MDLTATKGNKSTAEWALGAPPKEFVQVTQLPHRLRTLAFRRRTVREGEKNVHEVSGGEMKKVLGWFDFFAMGVGIIVATGIFSFSGYVYSNVTGPALVISMLLAAVTAGLSGLCYCEFAVEYPLAGGGFYYTLMSLGELPAVICAVNLIMDYVFGTAATARTFSVYLSQLCNKDHNIFIIHAGSYELDYMALIFSLLLTALCMYSTKVFSESNVVVQFVHIGLVIFVMIAAFTQANPDNFHAPSFFPYGERAIITGAGNIFFVFIGYDVISLGAEETKSDNAIPIGMMSAICFVTVIYVLMALALVMLVPMEVLLNQADSEYAALSSFAFGLAYNGLHWATYIVAAGACIGIVTSTGIGIYGFARVVTSLSRERLIPPILGWVWDRTGTPMLATAFVGLLVGLISFFTGFSTLVNMTSIGTLAMFYFVALSLLWRRYRPGMFTEEERGGRHEALPLNAPLQGLVPERLRAWVLALWLVIITAAPVGFAIYFSLSGGTVWFYITLGVWAGATLGLQLTIPVAYVPPKFSLQWWMMPWIPSASIWACAMLIGGYGAYKSDYVRFAVGVGIGLVVYLLYGIHASYYRFYGSATREEVQASAAKQAAATVDAAKAAQPVV